MREIQIKRKVRYHFMPVRMTIIKKGQLIPRASEDVVRGETQVQLIGKQDGTASLGSDSAIC